MSFVEKHSVGTVIQPVNQTGVYTTGEQQYEQPAPVMDNLLRVTDNHPILLHHHQKSKNSEVIFNWTKHQYA
jgi:hypothetical protein